MFGISNSFSPLLVPLRRSSVTTNFARRPIVSMSSVETTRSMASVESMVVKPLSHPTYDLKAVIALALAEDAGDRDIILRSQKVKTRRLLLPMVLKIVNKNGRLENLVDFQGSDTVQVENPYINTYDVSMDKGHALVGGLKFPIEIKSKYTVEMPQVI